MLQIVDFLSVPRNVVTWKKVRREDVSLLLFNDGCHVYVSDTICLNGNISWKWVRYADFYHFSDLYNHIHKNNIFLRHRGHVFAGWARIVLKQHLERVHGEGKIEMRRDWQMSLDLSPGRIVLVSAVNTEVVTASNVVGF